MNAIPKELFDFLVNDLQIPYEGDVAGLGTVQAHPVLAADTAPKTGHIGNGIFFLPAQVLTVQVKPQWNQGFVLPPDKKRELERKIETAISQEKPNGTREVNLGMDKMVALERGDSLSVKIDEYSQTVNISVSKSKASPAGISYQTETSSFKLSELKNYYPNLGRTITQNGDGGYSVSDEWDILGSALDVGGKGMYIGGLMATASEGLIRLKGLFSPITNHIDLTYGNINGGNSGWPKILTSRRATHAVRWFVTHARGIAYLGAFATIVYDGYGYYSYRKNPSSKHAVSQYKAILDIGFIALGLFSGPGSIASIMYFGIDGFYPGGWKGVEKHVIMTIPLELIAPKKVDVIFIDSPIDNSYPDYSINSNVPAG